VALTFDDGPDPRWTPRVLDALGEVGAAATFFVVAPRVRRWPELVRRALAEGHRVEPHCAGHVRHSELDRAGISADTAATLDTLAELGVEARLWRPPWGVRTPDTEEVARDYGLQLVGWTHDTHDWRGDAASRMLAAVRPGLGPGSVVLMHDGLGPGARRTGCRETVALIRPLVDHVRALGCEPATLLPEVGVA
jgi:peptidoglycan/xylan/chitin deacetylase (PgdA/CDA1 family)